MRPRKNYTDLTWQDEYMMTGVVRPGTNRFACSKMYWAVDDQRKYWKKNRERILKQCKKPWALRFDRKKS